MLTLRAGDLLANDGDLDADTLSITAVSNALGGTVVLGGTDVVFTPTANFTAPAASATRCRTATAAPPPPR